MQFSGITAGPSPPRGSAHSPSAEFHKQCDMQHGKLLLGSALHQMISLMLPYTRLQRYQCNTSEAGKVVSSLAPVTLSNPCDGSIIRI